MRGSVFGRLTGRLVGASNSEGAERRRLQTRMRPRVESLEDRALLAIADALEANANAVIAANALDLAEGRAKGLNDALLDRMLLNEKRIAEIAAEARSVVGLPDPVGAAIRSKSMVIIRSSL